MMRSYHNSISNVSSNNDSNNHNHNNNTNNKYTIGSSSSSSGSSNGAPTMNFQPPAPKLLQTSEPHAPASLGALFHMHDDGNRDDEDLFIDVDINTLASSYNMNMNTTSPSSLSIASSVSPIDYHQHSSTHLLNNNQQQQQQQQLLNSFNLNGSRRDIIVHNSRSNNTNYRNYFDDLDGNSVDQDDDDDDDQAMLPIVPIPEGVASVVELGSENIKRQYELDQLKYEQQKLLLRLNSQKRVSQSLQMISMRHPKPFDLSEAFPLLQQQQQHQQQQQQAYSIFSSSAPMINNNNNSNRLGQWQSTTTSQSLQPQSQMQRQQQQQSLSMSRIAELCNNATIRSTLKELSIHNFDTIDDWRDMCSKIKVVANEYPHIMTDMYPIVLCKRAPLITDCNGEYEKLFAISKAELKSKKTAFYDFMPEPLRQGMATLIDNINTRQVSAKDTVLNLEPKYNFKALIPDIYYVFNTRKIGMDMRGNVFEYVNEAHCMCDPWDPFHLRLVIVIVKQ